MPARRDHPRRHEVRARPRRRRDADARRRGLHAGLVALLARRRVRAGPRPAELRQAVRPRLGVLDRLGPHPARPGDPRRRRRPHAREVRRGLRADHRRAVRAVAGADRGGARRCARVCSSAQGRDPRSPGPGGRARAAGARLRRRAQRARRPDDRARRRGPERAARDVRAAAHEPADRGLRDPSRPPPRAPIR